MIDFAGRWLAALTKNLLNRRVRLNDQRPE